MVSNKIKASIVTLVVAIAAFVSGRAIWPPSPEMTPTTAQLPFFMLLSAFDSFTLGLGVAFIIFGLPLMSKISNKNKKRAAAMFVCIAWQLVSWWPHDNWHISNGVNIQRLLYIEYTFHVTLMVTSAILAYSLISIMKEKN
jgi:hypothetical protein